ncbi:tRNA (cytidine(34)-2'-O)-methyltransferase [Mycoplasma phocoenae]|uniref:Putative tRNA (cytidine(34)-2'-O)-methyltransferase n=1 Tax=Mycoplasma phocoenae TaxID=754517 RepID=A0A858U8M6_9MOLU|nr:tRNA (cytidine(34)-2'-O)-methyltransferase [Mycoplasma phocoenae]QJG67066.1 tRNA (cytidine(34)-2'-O)-methyltransferase [Mycoplasma phocoenae]
MINIVLYQPEISPNTSNIIRCCYATGAKLHIIKPIAFDLHPHWLKRAAAGHFLSDIPHEIHNSWNDFEKKYGSKNIFYISRYAQNTYSEIDYKQIYENEKEVWLMFGTESTGIPKKILQKNLDNCLRIPMMPNARSLNLSNTVAILSYEVVKQLDFENLSKYEVQKGKDFIKE